MVQFEEIDINFLKKFDKAGPRYTSYPTAPVFSDKFTDKNFEEELIKTNSDSNTSDISIYMHFPYCDTLCYFCGCNMLVTKDQDSIKNYNKYLLKEFDLIHKYINPGRKISQLHWGGGSPSYLSPEEIENVGMYLVNKTEFTSDIEASVEIDPRGLTKEHMEAFRKCGFNRISMGVQDFNYNVQRAVNRIQSEEITLDAINWSRELGFNSINLDLIYGLPYQTINTFEETLEKIIDISPDRIAVFNFAFVPWMKKHQTLIDPKFIPSPEEKLQILKMTIEKLTKANYWYIGMDHFAKPNDELAVSQRNKTLYRNFQGYSTKAGCDVYAMGMSAISQFENIYAQNHKQLKDYYNKINDGKLATAVGYKLSNDDIRRKDLIMDLMCHLEIDKNKFNEKYSIDFDKYFSNSITKLDEFKDNGLLVIDKDKIVVKELGKLIIRNIAMCFDAYLDNLSNDKPIFSRTV